MTDKQLRYINRLTVFVRKLLKLVPQDRREELENEFDSILLEVAEPDEKNNILPEIFSELISTYT